MIHRFAVILRRRERERKREREREGGREGEGEREKETETQRHSDLRHPDILSHPLTSQTNLDVWTRQKKECCSRTMLKLVGARWSHTSLML